MKVCSEKLTGIVLKKAEEIGKKIITSQQAERQITELPRFSPPEMIMARAQNRIAIHQARTAPRTFKFPKATPQDLERLTSNTIEASYSRVTWINPQDNKIYHILKETELENGNISIRILREDGSFLKNAEITPKKIIVIDDFSKTCAKYGIPHGEIVTTFLRRNNPFANIETIDTGTAFPFDEKFIKPFEEILERIKNGEKIDYISCSKGAICYTNAKNLRGMLPHFKPITEVAESGTRILFAAGNDTTKALNATNQILLNADKVEGVGSLSFKTGKISDFSASKNSFFTQHYEIGEHYVRPTEYGANITGIPGTDIVITNPQYQREIEHNFLVGKSKERVDNLVKKIEAEIYETQKKKMNLFRAGRIDFKAAQKLEDRITFLEKRKSKVLNYKNSLTLENDSYEAQEKFFGTSFSTPIRTAKLALNDMLLKVLG